MRSILLLTLAWLLAACSTLPPSAEPEAPAPEAATPAPPAEAPVAKGRESELIRTATQPLVDLNLMRSEIPSVLLAAQRGPYAEPAGHSCTALLTELQQLEAALGPDIDAAPAGQAADPGLLDQAVGVVGDMTFGTVKSTVNTVVDGVVPMRSWVRRLSGAEAHSSAVASSISAGTMRRAFLKGWAEGTGCAVTVPAKR